MYRKQRKHHVHFIGIGGIGMSGIASVLLELGYVVSGSDLRNSSTVRQLVQKGAHVTIGHAPENVVGKDVVVISSAISPKNPEVIMAKTLGIPVIPRAQMLAELMRLKPFGIAVSGTHGKTSTTSMLSFVLEAGGIDPTVVIGGQLKATGTNARWGQGKFLLAEADESDGSFLFLTPSIAVVTNVEEEHLDHYRDITEIKEAFKAFLKKVPFYGAAVVCGDDENLMACVKDLKRRVITYGLLDGNDIQAKKIQFKGIGSSFQVFFQGEPLGAIELAVPGVHHVRNSLAAIAVGMELEIPFNAMKKGLEAYTGVGRRFELLYNRQELTIIDDYAHHPTEIQATLKAARAAFPTRRLVVAFEPHRYTRTMALMEEFTQCFHEADKLYVTRIYPASEEPIVGISGERLASAISAVWGDMVSYVEDPFDLPGHILDFVEDGDVVLTLGAGIMGKVSKMLLEKVNERRYVEAQNPAH